MESQKTAVDKFTEFIGTVLGVTEDRFQKILDEFIVSHNFGKKESEVFSQKMKDIYDANKKKLMSIVDESVKKALSKADIARSSEIKGLEEKINMLEEKLNKQSAAHSKHKDAPISAKTKSRGQSLKNNKEK
jgi:polyhydroxyalkanoate synthesis regulator phasin